MTHISYKKRIILAAATAVIAIIIVLLFSTEKDRSTPQIDGQNMFATIKQQLDYGPRYLGSPGHEKTQRFLTSELEKYTDEVIAQSWDYVGTNGKNYKLANIVGRLNPPKDKRIILATHYDSKRFADRDPEHSSQPVPGANDSASGVAVLLELAQRLHQQPAEIGIDFVFFDGEEGDINLGNDYADWKPLGSTYFANHLEDFYGNTKPQSALVLDMVCDKNLGIYKERNSVKNAPDQVAAFWSIAQKSNKDVFKSQTKHSIRDDHTPLNQTGIPSILLIDYDYPHFHTTKDTLDKCSENSLKTVAQAVLKYVYSLN